MFMKKLKFAFKWFGKLSVLAVLLTSHYSVAYTQSCENIEEIYCGYQNIFDTRNYSNSLNFVSDYNGCPFSPKLLGNNSYNGNDVVFRIQKPADDLRPWHISIFNNSSIDLDMFLLDYCPYDSLWVGRIESNTGNCIRTSLNTLNNPWGRNNKIFGDYNYDVITIQNPGVYYLVVDGVNANQLGEFSLNVGCDLFPHEIYEGAPCQYEALECNTLVTKTFDPDVFVITESPKMNAYSCLDPRERGSLWGWESIFSFTAPKDGVYEIILNPLDGDLDMFIVPNVCAPGFAVGNPPISSFVCTDFSNQPGLNQEIIEIQLFQRQEIFIVVDGFLIDWSDFDIVVNCLDDVCSNAEEVECGQNYFGNFSNTTSEINRYACTGQGQGITRYENPEIIYTFTPSTSGIYSFNTLSVPGPSPAIFLSDCCDVDNSSEPLLECPFVQCGNTNNLGINTLEAQLVAGKTYYIFIEKQTDKSSEGFIFWINCDCNFFKPISNQTGNDIVFTNKSPGSYISHTIKFPYDETGQNYTYTDSLSRLNPDSTITCHFPFPGCYEVCFYYQVDNQVQKCCFKYCPVIPSYDCNYPVIEEVNSSADSSTIHIDCIFEGNPVRTSQQFREICQVKITPLGGGTVIDHFCGDNITLPHGEYEICCWNFDEACHTWNVCCKVVCLPLIPPDQKECASQNIITTQVSNNVYNFSWAPGGPPALVSWSVMPDAIIGVSNGLSINVEFPTSGRYKVCASGPINDNLDIDTCCQYICIDETFEEDCENSFIMRPLPGNLVQLICTSGKPVYRWEVSFLPPGGDLFIRFTLYGNNPIFEAIPGTYISVTKFFAGCCGMEMSCSKSICYIDPFDCTYITPRYLGGPGDLSLEYGFSIPDYLVGIEWRIDELDIVIGENTSSVSYNFLTPGCYTISVLIYDPINECYIICCKRICIDYPFDCTLLKYWFAGDESNPHVYTLQLDSDCTDLMRQNVEIKWSINGTHYPEFDNLSSLHNIDLSSYGAPGSDIIICAMFYDPCLRACRWCCIKIRLEPPFNCNTFTPLYISENNYTFSATGNYEKTYWMIGGLEGLCFNMDQNTFDLSDPEIQNYVTAQQPEYLLVYFYYRVGFCWKVCCIRICLKGPDGCEQFGDECDYFRPIYNEDFENGPPLGFGYMEGDSININMDWWKGKGVVNSGKGFMSGDDILCLRLDNPALNNVSIFKVTADFDVLWIRNLMTGQYNPVFSGEIALCQADLAGNGLCYSPSLSEIISNNPSLLKYCGTGNDLGPCTHSLQILIDRSGPVKMFIDGRKVNYTGQGGNNWENQGATINKINFAGDGFNIDNVCVAECMECVPPLVNPGDFFPCDQVRFLGFGTGFGESINGQFFYEGPATGEGWIVKEVNGDMTNTIYEDFSGTNAFFFPGFLPGNTYIVCYKYFDENGCVQYCCYKVFIPDNCGYVKPGFTGTGTELTYRFMMDEGEATGLEPYAWYVEGTQIGGAEFQVNYTFPLPGRYNVYCVFWDPITRCYIWCCKTIIVSNPYDCQLLKYWFTGSETNPYQYTIQLDSDCTEPMRGFTEVKWSINGIERSEFDGLMTLDNVNLLNYGQPGTDIIICAMFYDPCLRACRWCYFKIRLALPFNCNEYTDDFVTENDYAFFASGSYEATYWMVGGLDGQFFNEGLNFFNLSEPAIQNYITAQQPEYLFVYFYYRVGFCWKVCCKKICLKGPDQCEEFGEECDYFRPIYNEDFENGPPLGFGYTLGDSININSEWWRGHGGVVDADFTSQSQNAGHIKGDNILQLHFDNAQTANIPILKVTYEISLEWSRDLMTGNYGTSGLDGDIFICSDAQCYGPSINDLILNTNLFKFCNNGGGDIAYCSHRIEILIDRSGPVEMFVDGRKVPSPNGFEDKGDIISSLSIGGGINGGIRIDNVCIAECMTCQTPTVDPGDFFPCDDIALNGFGSGANNAISGQFTYNGTATGEGWVVKEVLGTVMTTVYEDFSGSTTLTFPGFLPGRTYIVCFKYLDENGCVQYCCYKVNIPDDCHYYTPYFAGDDDPENLTFDFVLENPNPDGLELVAWYVGDTKVADNVSTLTYRFPGQGTYYVYCVFWDPLTKCYVWCCRRICVEYPLNCDRIIIDYDGANNEYILSATGIQQIISWNIDIPAGLPNRGYIGMDNPQRFNPADFGIQPGQEIVISVRYIDADGCLKICCRRICVPVVTPVEECDNIFPVYTGNGLEYKFVVDPANDFEDIIWRLHIPGTDQTIDIGSGSMSDVIDFEALAIQYPTLMLDKVCISIFYRDRVTGCYKVCCKCFCIAQNPFDCTSIKYYYAGSPANSLVYNFILDVPGAQFISWTLDNTNTFLSDLPSFEVDFESLGVSLGDEIFVSVRYFDPVSLCFKVCCKRLCLSDPYSGCDKISSGLPVNNIISLSTQVNNPVWTIEGLPGIYSESQNPTIDLTNPLIIPLLQGNTSINVCVVYMENGCCRVCCTPVCVLPATVNCDNFDIFTTPGVTDFTFGFTDSNTGAINTEITLPNGIVISLPGDAITYSNNQEGEYTICRNYLNGCQDTISCCQSFCLSFGLNCEPITFSINPANDRLYTFTHNIIGGVSYLWDFGDGNTSTSDLTTVMHTYSNENRQYTVCLTVIDECNTFCQQCRDIAVGEINFSPMVVNPSCRNTNDGSIDLNITGGIPPIVIIWSNGSTSESISNLSVGNYSVTVTDGSGKDTTFTFSLTAPELANLEAAVTHTLCGESNGEISINVLNNVGIQSYNWSLTSIASNPIASLLTAGSYAVTVTDVNGCTAALEGIIVNPSETLAAFDFGMDEILCPDITKTLDVGVVNASNVTIQWFKDGVLVLSNTRTLEISGAGTYVAVVSNTQNCERRDTIIVNYFADGIELPEDRFDIDLDEVVTLEAIGAVSAEWVTTDAVLSCTSCLTTTFTFVKNTTIIVTATDANGCTKVDTIDLRFDTSPIDGPNFFTPNGDGANDVLEFENLDRFIYRKLTIFNRWGQILLTLEGYNNDWDGTLGGRPLPDGAYYYVLRYGSNTPDQYEFKSDVTIIRRQ